MRQLAGIVCLGIILAVALRRASARPGSRAAEVVQGQYARPLARRRRRQHAMSCPWYREQRYHFLLHDHNVVTPVDGLNAVFVMPDRFLVIGARRSRTRPPASRST